MNAVSNLYIIRLAVHLVRSLGYSTTTDHIVKSNIDCASAITNGGAPAAAGDCNMLCAGKNSEFCGGPNRLNVYNYTGTDLSTGGNNGGGGNNAAGIFPVLSGLPTGWAYNACWVYVNFFFSSD